MMISVIGLVSASDDINNEDVATQPQTVSSNNVNTENVEPNEIVSDSTNKGNSFNDLNSLISDSNEINLTQDYVFDEAKDTDYTEGITINNREKLVINGNNHTINAENKCVIFKLNSSKVVLNNIIFKNSNITAIEVINSTLNSSNNMYINDLNNSRAIRGVIGSTISSINDSFVDNYNKYGSSIYIFDSALTVTNANFRSKYSPEWATIYVDGEMSTGYVLNSTFTDINASYSPALFINSGEFAIVNCTFKNLFANLTAGAIGIRNVNKTISIVNSSFINVSSVKNGGAIYVDAGPSNRGNFIALENCLFEDCYSLIGGAIVQLEGKLGISNTIFNNNRAVIEGGAIYTSFTDIMLINDTFNDNKIIWDDDYYSSGGALYIDASKLTIENSKFTGNYAENGEDILLYDSHYDISGSSFDGDIYSLYDDEDCELDNNSFKKKNILNDTFNPYVYEGPGASIDYDPVILDENLVNSSYFNLVDYGLVTDVKNQGDMGSCWAFGTVASLESAFLKATNRKLVLDISENNVQSLGLRYSHFGNIAVSEGGLRTIGTSYFLSWLGVTNTEDDEYDELGKLSPIIDSGKKHFLYDVIFIEPRQNMSDNAKLKEALVKYGAISISVHGAQGSQQKDYNDITHCAYYNSTFGEGTDHTVTLVGWNDTFSKENFQVTPPGDGAWIIKNSWGSDWGDNGYYYVSYYDTSVATKKIITAFNITNSYNLDRNYEYDMIVDPSFEENLTGTVGFGNKFTAVYDELISAVGTYFNDSGINYEIIVYVDDEEMYRQNGTSNHYGYETIKLEHPVGVRENHTFLIKVFSNNVAISAYSRQHYDENTSFLYKGDTIKDISKDDEVACLKAYTITDNSQIKTDNLTTEYDSGEYINVTCYDEKGELLSNREVQFMVNNKTYIRTTNAEGTAILDENFEAGTYVVTVVNPVSLEKTNVTLTILENPAENITPGENVTPEENDTPQENNIPEKSIQPAKIILKQTPVKVTNKVNYPVYKIYKNDKIVSKSNTITINTLNILFCQSFTNGHLVVYLDGKVVFNDTVTDDIYRIILEITSKLLGQHEITVEFTNNNNQTQSYTENITITV